MPVLIEANSVIVLREAIATRMHGGWENFVRLAPASTLCTDGELVRVGFDTQEAMVEFLRALRDRGLRYGVGPADDDVATFQLGFGPQGPEHKHSPCARIVYSYYAWTESGWQVIGAVLQDGQAPPQEVAVPPGWAYERSASWGLRVEV